MQLFELVNVIKWPECLPLYYLKEEDYFYSSFSNRPGFATSNTDPTNKVGHYMSEKWLVLLKGKEK
jgi:hypothetical protein